MGKLEYYEERALVASYMKRLYDRRLTTIKRRQYQFAVG